MHLKNTQRKKSTTSHWRLISYKINGLMAKKHVPPHSLPSLSSKRKKNWWLWHEYYKKGYFLKIMANMLQKVIISHECENHSKLSSNILKRYNCPRNWQNLYKDQAKKERDRYWISDNTPRKSQKRQKQSPNRCAVA